MDNPLTGALFFIATALLHLYALVIWMRFLAQAVRADFYNPITQSIVTISDPVLSPVRKLLSVFGTGRFDYASLVVVWLLSVFLIWVSLRFPSFDGQSVRVLLIQGTASCISILLRIYFFTLLVLVIASWVAPGSRNVALQLLNQIAEPLLAPIRNLLPNTGMLDFSVLIAFLIITALENYIVPGLVSVAETAWLLR